MLSLGQKAVLADPQATVVGGWAAQSQRKLMLLSRHQFVSSYDLGDIGTVLPAKVGPLLDSGRIAAWLWGHEHRCMGFQGVRGVPFARGTGHGGIPVPATKQTAKLPPPGLWQEFGSFREHHARWNSFGFAVLDFAGPSATVRHRGDRGAAVREETIG